MGLAKILEKGKGTSSLRKIIESIIKQSNDKPPLNPSDPNSRISISAIASLCPREEVICSRMAISRVQVVDAGLGMAFKTGSALHEATQSQILSESPCFLGIWKCTDCGRPHGSQDPEISRSHFVPCPKECSNPECSSNDPQTRRSAWEKKATFRYKEIRIEDKDLRISGRMDGILSLPGLPGFGVFELKSASQNSAWKVRNVPQAEHVIQCQLYMMLTGFRWAKILYWNKAGTAMDTFIEHTVEREEITFLELRSQIMSIWKGIRENTLPERICANEGCDRAKSCAVRSNCFKFTNLVPDGGL